MFGGLQQHLPRDRRAACHPIPRNYTWISIYMLWFFLQNLTSFERTYGVSFVSVCVRFHVFRQTCSSQFRLFCWSSSSSVHWLDLFIYKTYTQHRTHFPFGKRAAPEPFIFATYGGMAFPFPAMPPQAGLGCSSMVTCAGAVCKPSTWIGRPSSWGHLRHKKNCKFLKE